LEFYWIIPSDSIVFENAKKVQKRLHYERAKGHGVYWQWYHLKRGEDQDRWQIDSLYIIGSKIGNEYFGKPSPPVAVTFQSNGVLLLTWNKNIDENIIKYRIYSGKHRNDLFLVDSTVHGHDTSIVISNSENKISYYRVTAVNNLYLESDYSVRVTALDDNINAVSSRYSREEEYALYPNYPNPFNHSTTIQFKVSKSISVDLKLYDITGKLVSVLKNDKFNAGLYKFSFERNELASGLYFLQMKTPHFIRTRKLLIIN
jgi:hypothetical protein